MTRKSTPQDVLARIDWTGQHPCSPWTGAVTEDGYGQLGYRGRTWYAHRLVYELLVGPIPEGHDVDHECHNEDPLCPGGSSCAHRRCCEPGHLSTKPRIENVRAGKLSRTRCKRGHDLTDPANLKPNRRGARQCRACSNLARHDRYVRLGR